jgi:hypothetical protein
MGVTNAMAVGLQGRQQAGSDFVWRNSHAGKNAAATPLHPLSRRSPDMGQQVAQMRAR